MGKNCNTVKTNFLSRFPPEIANLLQTKLDKVHLRAIKKSENERKNKIAWLTQSDGDNLELPINDTTSDNDITTNYDDVTTNDDDITTSDNNTTTSDNDTTTSAYDITPQGNDTITTV